MPEYSIKGLLLFCTDTAVLETSGTLEVFTALASKPKNDIRNKPRKDMQLIIRLNLFFIQTPFPDYNLFFSIIKGEFSRFFVNDRDEKEKRRNCFWLR